MSARLSCGFGAGAIRNAATFQNGCLKSGAWTSLPTSMEPPETKAAGLPGASMTVQAYCPECEKTVSAQTLLDGEGLKRGLSRNQEINVIHAVTFPERIDHCWTLSDLEKRTLRGTIGG